MTNIKLALGLMLCMGIPGLQAVSAQTQLPPPPKPIATPTPVAAPTLKISVQLTKTLEMQTTEVSRERREQAYAKLLEGQRYYTSLTPYTSPASAAVVSRLSRQALLKAVELNPKLSEAYTALAENTINTSGDIEEAAALANLAIKIFPDNYGARRILARVYTFKSRLKPERDNTFNPEAALQAVNAWKEITRLDPRSAESWAFLSELYDKLDKQEDRISALKRWLAAAVPVDAKFYRAVMGPQEDLSPERASVKLGAALVKVNRQSEAVEVLSQSVADDPDNAEAIELLKQAIDGGSGPVPKATLEALQQAVFANPTNLVLIRLLAQVQSRGGQMDDAVKSLSTAVAKLVESDKDSAASLQVSIGDIFNEANRTDDSINAYEAALKTYGIDKTELATDGEREFATAVFGKMIQIYKTAGRLNEAKAAIERARVLLGKDDLFADHQMISLMRENDKNAEALQTVRALRTRMKTDYGLLRLEASILTDMGRVEEGVALIRPLIGKGKTLSAPSLMFDDFNNYIYISSLYNQAKRGKEAILSAQKAYSVAETDEKKQIAHLTLANAQQTSGDYKSAEDLLRNLLKQSPNNPIALNNLGYFLLERDQKLEEAVSLIKQAVDIDPTNSSYLDSLGWGYYKLGKLADAEQYLKDAINNDGSSATIYEHLGDVYQKQGKEDLAKSAWQKAKNLATGMESNNRLKDKLASITTK